MHRLENQVRDSHIRAIYTLTGDQCGILGPRFIIQNRDGNQKEMPREQLADFLNDASGIDSGRRLIDESVEKGLFNDFSDVLSFESGRYVYKGPGYSGPSGYFSASYKESNNESLLDFARRLIGKSVSVPSGSSSASYKEPNNASGMDLDRRPIDESVEEELFSDDSDVVPFFKSGLVYNGPGYSVPSGHFSVSDKESRKEAESAAALDFANYKDIMGTLDRFLSTESYAITKPISLSRLENQVKDSPIRAILTRTGDQCGTVGPHFIIQDRNSNQKLMPRAQLADFLNDASGIDSGRRLIDESVEKGLFSGFSDVLSFESGRYVYKGPGYSGPSGYFSASYKESREEAESEAALLGFANSKDSKGTLGHFSPTESYAILQHEVGITSGLSTKPIIGSYGAGPCIIIAIWNASTKEAVLAHVDPLTTFSSVKSLFRRISSDENDKLEVHLHGGSLSNQKQALKMVALVKSQKNSELVSADLCNGYVSNSFAIDSRTGKTSTTFSEEQLEHSSDSEKRLKSLGLQFTKSSLNLVFDGRGMIQQATVASSPFC